MKNGSADKKGFTLVELLVVVAVIGILSTMGVVSLRGAVENNKLKDTAMNLVAFLDRVSAESNRLNTPLCVKPSDAQTLVVYKESCDGNLSTATRLDQFTLESGFSLVSKSISGLGTNWYTKGASFKPKLGLSAAPFEGCFVAQMGSAGDDAYSVAQKISSKNSFARKYKKGGDTWNEF